MNLVLTRLDSTAEATYGHLATDEHRVLACTLELPWRNNQPDVSCIPLGTYQGIRYASPHFGGDVLRFTVPGREGIELHVGNTVSDTHGCILVGQSFGTVNGQHGIINSRVAFQHVMEAMRGVDAVTLTVINQSEQSEAA